MSMPDFFGAFYFYTQEVLQTREGRAVPIEIAEAGALVLTSGRIVACDGLIPSDEPFTERVKPGSYPVVLCIAMFSEPESWVEIIMTAEFSIISSISARKSEYNLMSTCLYYITAN